jgi:hypothetical protein
MPKETDAGSNQNGLVYLKYTFRYRIQFDEPNEDWLDVIEATSDELLGEYSKAEDTLATSSASRSKKVKVLTRQPRLIETVVMPKLIEGAAPITDPSRSVSVEARTNVTEEPKLEKMAEQLKALRPPCATELPKPSSIPATTPRKRRMASVLDVVMEYVKTSTLASAEALRTKAKVSGKNDVASTTQTATETGTTEVPVEAGPSENTPITLEKESTSEKFKSPAPKASARELEFIVRHALGKQLSERQVAEVQHYTRDLKYPRGSLVYGGDDEDDFLYFLPDNKEINVYREMADNIDYLKLELGLSAMLNDQLADSLAYNNLKVCMFWFVVL